MANDSLEQMKAFILLTESFVQAGKEGEPVLELAPPPPLTEEATSHLKRDLRDLLFKLRSYQEDHDDNAYALGVEAGMMKASDMLENLLKRSDADGGEDG